MTFQPGFQMLSLGARLISEVFLHGLFSQTHSLNDETSRQNEKTAIRPISVSRKSVSPKTKSPQLSAALSPWLHPSRSMRWGPWPLRDGDVGAQPRGAPRSCIPVPESPSRLPPTARAPRTPCAASCAHPDGTRIF